MPNDTRRIKISSTAVPVRGDDIDTDRIVPARYLRTVTFDGLGARSFEDDRAELKERGEQHAFDNPAFGKARILLVNKNFGCGSSREHAPQALVRWNEGIAVIVGESFAEIFNANCFSLGVPCVTLSESEVRQLMSLVEGEPSLELEIDFEQRTIRAGALQLHFEMSDGVRKRFLEGLWDSTTELLGNQKLIEQTAANLPYVNDFASS